MSLLIWRLSYRWHTALRTSLFWRPRWLPERWEYQWLCLLDVLLEPLFKHLDPGNDDTDYWILKCTEWQQQVHERQRWPDRLEVARAQIVRLERQRAEFWAGDIHNAWDRRTDI